MTTNIADAIMEGIKPSGTAVVVQAEHLCMIMRGIKKPGSAIVTSALRGAFRTKAETRTEFFCLLQGK
jgi:GTP cyclohydrolase I